MNPKQCECGIQGFVIDSRQYDEYITRRLECKTCNKRWSTVEIRLEGDNRGKNIHTILSNKYSTMNKEDVADKLIALAQEVLHGT